eukprot:Rmarinus@m.4130
MNDVCDIFDLPTNELKKERERLISLVDNGNESEEHRLRLVEQELQERQFGENIVAALSNLDHDFTVYQQMGEIYPQGETSPHPDTVAVDDSTLEHRSTIMGSSVAPHTRESPVHSPLPKERTILELSDYKLGASSPSPIGSSNVSSSITAISTSITSDPVAATTTPDSANSVAPTSIAAPVTASKHPHPTPTFGLTKTAVDDDLSWATMCGPATTRATGGTRRKSAKKMSDAKKPPDTKPPQAGKRAMSSEARKLRKLSLPVPPMSNAVQKKASSQSQCHLQSHSARARPPQPDPQAHHSASTSGSRSAPHTQRKLLSSRCSVTSSPPITSTSSPSPVRTATRSGKVSSIPPANRSTHPHASSFHSRYLPSTLPPTCPPQKTISAGMKLKNGYTGGDSGNDAEVAGDSGGSDSSEGRGREHDVGHAAPGSPISVGGGGGGGDGCESGDDEKGSMRSCSSHGACSVSSLSSDPADDVRCTAQPASSGGEGSEDFQPGTEGPPGYDMIAAASVREVTRCSPESSIAGGVHVKGSNSPSGDRGSAMGRESCAEAYLGEGISEASWSEGEASWSEGEASWSEG